MKLPAERSAWSFGSTLVFWWILFLVIQQAGRLYLIPEAMSIEPPGEGILFRTLATGLRADLIVATLGALMAALAAWAAGTLGWAYGRWRGGHLGREASIRRALMLSGGVIAAMILILLAVNMGYYFYGHQYLDFVFFEYVQDLMAPGPKPTSQAALQTSAELKEIWKWAARATGFLVVQVLAAGLWLGLFRRASRWGSVNWPHAKFRTVTLSICLGVGLTGFHPYGPWSVQRANISSSTYYLLSQNPIWYGGEAMAATFASGLSGTVSDLLRSMPLEQAVRLTQETVDSTSAYRYERYPLVRDGSAQKPSRPVRPNVLLIFVEGLDRRYLGRVIDPGKPSEMGRWFIYDSPAFQYGHGSGTVPPDAILLTPFLDRLRTDSVYFDHFFANGTQTSRGLFATLCSYYPRQGTAVMKTRYTLDYLCLPSVLKRAGYKTEMIVGQNRDRNYDHIGLFLARNGIERMFDRNDFPPDAEAFGVGMTDGALFEFVRARLQTLRKGGAPFFLATLTVGTHHPYEVIPRHPDVQRLQSHADRYVPALRNLDLEFERFFIGLERDGLLSNTIVLILGDHGRHHGNGRTETERWAGHFTSPLYIWVDPSLRTTETYRPRVVSAIASQVDVAPTVLAMTGLTPSLSPFLGHDLSCLLRSDCLEDNVAFLTSVYDEAVGLADREGIWFYAFRDSRMYQHPLALNGLARVRETDDPGVVDRQRRVLALYITANVLLEQNRIWSWKELGGKL
jgi:hypothetical protein